MDTVPLCVHAWLRKQRPDLAPRNVEIGGGATVQALLDAVGLVPPDGAIVLVNDRRADPSAPLCVGDSVSVFPILEGG